MLLPWEVPWAYITSYQRDQQRAQGYIWLSIPLLIIILIENIWWQFPFYFPTSIYQSLWFWLFSHNFSKFVLEEVTLRCSTIIKVFCKILLNKLVTFAIFCVSRPGRFMKSIPRGHRCEYCVAPGFWWACVALSIIFMKSV